MTMNAEKVQAEIQRVIGDDPTIAEPTHIMVSVERRGFLSMGKEVVVLRGSVHSEADKAKAEKIAEMHSAGRQVVDEIHVVH
jgi:osmotically-inducible protein OsmY